MGKLSRRYDVLIVGAGHNGLVAAAYLARAGLSVGVLERRPVIGGACTTEVLWDKYRVSTAAYVCGLLHPKIIRELRLPRHGFTLLKRDPSSFTPLPDGGSLLLGFDPSFNAEQIRFFSPKDAEAFRHYEAMMDELAEAITPFLVTVPPRLPKWTPADLPTFGKLLASFLSLSPSLRGFLRRLFTESAWSILSDWFESEALKITLATDGVIGTAKTPTMPGTGLVLFHHVMGSVTGRRGVWGYVRGGMGALSEAIAAVAKRHGAVILTETEVERILVRDGRAIGVALKDGTEIDAPIVLSNADPKRTFLHLVPRDELPPEFLHRIEGLKMSAAAFKVNLVVDALPEFRCLRGKGTTAPLRGTIHLCPSLAYLEEAFADFTRGLPSERPMVEMCIPTLLDETLAPEGHHIVSLFVQYAPYEPKGGWKALKDKFFRSILSVVDEFAPGFSSRIVHSQTLSPKDLEEEFALSGGNIFHGDLELTQSFSFRPAPNWGQYRTPVRGLYLCGAGAHPGGGVIGAAGYNAARVVLKDWRSSRV